MTHNQLSDQSSPYLRQHKDNPVHWYAWGPEAFEAARAENKPILLSVGYAACHWCHVMAHESFEDETIAELMNRLFINIKVDREERPDIDYIYQNALQLLGEQGGWPLTMFLTPERDPFWGGTYFPSTPKYGRPGFPQILQHIETTYRDDPNRIAHNVTAINDALQQIVMPKAGGQLSRQALDQAAAILIQSVDDRNGGTQGAPKFPQPGFFRFLWNAYKRTGDNAYKGAVLLTLDNICHGGIYDHLSGGFARYSTDEYWLAPHFEKMLYDNAQLVELMASVWKETKSRLYEQRIAETVTWLLRDMKNGPEEGAGSTYGFAAAFDADSEGEEGKFCVWSEAEIDQLLGDASHAFKDIYDVGPHGNWEGHTILNRSAHMDHLGDAEEAALRVSRETLFAERQKRIPPIRDDKVLADWNGMMIAALAKASVCFDQPSWLEEAKTAYSFVMTHMTSSDRLSHSWCAGKAAHPATLDDYANMARAALILFETTIDATYLGDAKSWVATLDAHYWDEDGGAYFLSADDTDDTIVRPKTALDNAVPPGNGTMTEVLARLFHITGDSDYEARANALISALTPEDPRASLNHPTLMCGFELLVNATQVILIGSDKDPALIELHKTALRAADPNLIVTVMNEGTSLPTLHPAFGKTQIDGKATAYICQGVTCGLPLTDCDALNSSISGPPITLPPTSPADETTTSNSYKQD